ncbi:MULTISPECIES: AHH domain-containing protein [Aeribacillus]|uniref:AHH domain-containing protein n=1 Tax=Aeribacillus TaxID=1055323 RepID=UPI001398011B|nr:MULTISPECIES: AHH domain-containing protein [Aeribacillus]MDR9796032.1 AHH domain-containing protein [Aeribacillus pallidus]MED0704221.1 AHH domain-containing protein [Aeribacillus composti]BBU39214.1 hypothetical protein APP_15060 [Aeribacillus pallidus]
MALNLALRVQVNLYKNIIMLLIISKKYTPQIEAITKKYGLDLDDVWNIELLPHHGRHPNAYHEYVLSNIRTFDKIAKGDKRKFLRLFEQVKQEIRKNPEMLYKDYWRKK